MYFFISQKIFICFKYRLLRCVFDKKLDIDEVMSLKIHDVTPDFVRRAREKGFKDMSVDEYIQLKIQFGSKIK